MLFRSTESGYAAMEQRCMACHGSGVIPSKGNAPLMTALRNLSAEKVYEVLTSGPGGTHQGLTFTDDQKKRIAEGTAGRLLDTLEAGDAKSMPNKCSANPPLKDAGSMPSWNGWGAGVSNTRFQDAKNAGLTAEQLPKLKLKWAFGYPNGVTGWVQPAVVGGRVYIGKIGRAHV